MQFRLGYTTASKSELLRVQSSPLTCSKLVSVAGDFSISRLGICKGVSIRNARFANTCRRMSYIPGYCSKLVWTGEISDHSERDIGRLSYDKPIPLVVRISRWDKGFYACQHQARLR